MFEARTAAVLGNYEAPVEAAREDFRTPANPEVGWASRNPERALLFLFVSPRDCGVVEELMAL
ncbi:MAG TPA: hypothetical protein VGB59_02645 [Allosphingosinicella sp.]|jgi:hypothetical protein